MARDIVGLPADAIVAASPSAVRAAGRARWPTSRGEHGTSSLELCRVGATYLTVSSACVATFRSPQSDRACDRNMTVIQGTGVRSPWPYSEVHHFVFGFSQAGLVLMSLPPHAEHFSFRPTSGTGNVAGKASTFTVASCWQVLQVANTDRTPFSRMLARSIGGIIVPSELYARRWWRFMGAGAVSSALLDPERSFRLGYRQSLDHLS